MKISYLLFTAVTMASTAGYSQTKQRPGTKKPVQTDKTAETRKIRKILDTAGLGTDTAKKIDLRTPSPTSPSPNNPNPNDPRPDPVNPTRPVDNRKSVKENPGQ